MTHGSARPLVAALLVLALAGACQATTTPSPSAAPATPAGTPEASASGPAASPSPAATPSPEPTAVPTAAAAEAEAYSVGGDAGDVLFAPDGRIVMVTRDFNANRSQVVSLDANGAVLAGWPWSAGDTGSPIATAALGPERSVYVAVRSAEGSPETYSWDLHRLDIGGNELAGFPVALAKVATCALTSTSDGGVISTCEDDAADTGASTTTFALVRPDGSTAPGWPITRDGSATIDGFLPDGALVAWLGAVGGSTLIAIRVDGSAEPGWPIAAPDDGGVAMVDDAGHVRITSRSWSEGQCGPATGTTYTVRDTGGTPLPGWPVHLTGWASDPLVAGDGSMTIVTEGGKALRYGLDGKAAGGWTASKVSVVQGCYGGSSPVHAGNGGTLVIGARATLLDPSGTVAPGWPVKLPFEAALECPDCTPGPNAPLAPAVGNDGIYVAAYGDGPRVIALARDGSRIDGGQRSVGKAGDVVTWIRIAPSGRVWMLLRRSLDESTLTMLVPVAQDSAPAG